MSLNSTRLSFSKLRHYLTYSYAQFWFWGQDLQHHKSATLIAYGFQRFPPPEGVGGRSMYLLVLPSRRFLCLWAYGLLIGECGKPAIFVPRGSFRLQITQKVIPTFPTEHITFDDLRVCLGLHPFDRAFDRAFDRPFDCKDCKHNNKTIQLWWDYQADLISAIIRYEGWIRELMGTSYRQLCLTRWRNRRFELSTLIPTLLELNQLGRVNFDQKSAKQTSVTESQTPERIDPSLST